MRSAWISIVCGSLLIVLWNCHEPSERTMTGEVPDEPPASVGAASQTTESPRGLKPAALDLVDEPDRWLFVEKVREEAPGAWATGSFDPKRNKLDIRTRDVQRFAIDVSRIPINWERLVVIGIDGVNSELRRRDYSVFHFRRSRHGQWIVDEP